MANGSQDVQALITKRLIETGEWDRIHKSLTEYLLEAGIQDDIKNLAKELVRKQENPNLKALQGDLLPQATKLVSPDIKKAILQEIEAAIDRHVEST